MRRGQTEHKNALRLGEEILNDVINFQFCLIINRCFFLVRNTTKLRKRIFQFSEKFSHWVRRSVVLWFEIPFPMDAFFLYKLYFPFGIYVPFVSIQWRALNVFVISFQYL